MHLGYIRSGKGKHVQFHASINGIDVELFCSSMHLGEIAGRSMCMRLQQKASWDEARSASGPLVKSPAEGLTQNIQDDLSPSNNEDEA